MQCKQHPLSVCVCVCVFSVFSLDFLDELAKIEAHDSEVLCLAFSPFSTGKIQGQRSVKMKTNLFFLRVEENL